MSVPATATLRERPGPIVWPIALCGSGGVCGLCCALRFAPLDFASSVAVVAVISTDTIGIPRTLRTAGRPGTFAPAGSMRAACSCQALCASAWALSLWLVGPPQVLGQEPLASEFCAEPTVVIAPSVSPPRWHAEVDYLYWFLRRDQVGPLLTTGTRETLGVLGQPGTVILYPVDGELHSRHNRFIGVRTTAECWCDEARTNGIQLDAFFLERDSSILNLKRPPPGRLLAQPYVDAVTGQQAAEIVAGPLPDGREVAGRFYVYQRIELFGEQANWLRNLTRGETWALDLLAGAHFLQMRNRLDITAVSRVLPAEAHLLSHADHLWTFNRFYGGQLGLRGDWRWGRVAVDGYALAALGATAQEINAKGERIDHDPTRRLEFHQGLFVLASNRGRHDRYSFDWMSEVGVNLGVDVTRWLRATVGYSFLYWDGPVRATDQLDAVNRTQMTGPIVGPARPAIPFREDYFWAQGLKLGLACRW